MEVNESRSLSISLSQLWTGPCILGASNRTQHRAIKSCTVGGQTCRDGGAAAVRPWAGEGSRDASCTGRSSAGEDLFTSRSGKAYVRGRGSMGPAPPSCHPSAVLRSRSWSCTDLCQLPIHTSGRAQGGDQTPLIQTQVIRTLGGQDAAVIGSELGGGRPLIQPLAQGQIIPFLSQLLHLCSAWLRCKLVWENRRGWFRLFPPVSPPGAGRLQDSHSLSPPGGW